MFHKAVKSESKLRLAIYGPSGSGKTYTSLRLASALGKRVAVIDTERGSASKYADLFQFDVANLAAPYHPDRFLEALRAAEAAGYDVAVIDSLSHAWNGPGGLLEIVDEEARKSKSGNTFQAWSKGTPLQNKLIDGLISCRMHLVATMRSKTEYVVEQNERGRSAPRKVGTAPIQRDGMEYEFDVVLDMSADNEAVVQKTRCPELTGRVFPKPGSELSSLLVSWLAGAPLPSPEERARLEFARTEAVNAFFELGKNVFGKPELMSQWLLDRGLTVKQVKTALSAAALAPIHSALQAEGLAAMES